MSTLSPSVLRYLLKEYFLGPYKTSLRIDPNLKVARGVKSKAFLQKEYLYFQPSVRKYYKILGLKKTLLEQDQSEYVTDTVTITDLVRFLDQLVDIYYDGVKTYVEKYL